MFLLDGEDFEVTDSSELNQEFISGTSEGSVCLTIDNLVDTVIENTESYIVSISSDYNAVSITQSNATIMLFDNSTGRLDITACKT